MKYFKELTMGHHVLMGRKTYDSIPTKFKPLPGRTNLIVSRRKDYRPDGAIVFENIDEAIEYANRQEEKVLMVIGGGEIYRQTLPLADIVYITRVHQSFPNADTHFHFQDASDWEQLSSEFHAKDEKNPYDFEFLVFERKQRHDIQAV